MASYLSRLFSPWTGTPEIPEPQHPPQLAILDFFFPGFSVLSSAIQKYLHIDLNLYIPMLVLLGAMTFLWNYLSEFLSGKIESHFMSTVDIRTDDEIYNMLMGWVARQRFAQASRRFVVNTSLNSRCWWLWSWHNEEDESSEDSAAKKKALSYTPSFGSHYFWYNGRILLFRRTQNREQASYYASEKEEISISCFGRNPWILKELLHEARQDYIHKDEQKTLIYRGSIKASNGGDPSWQRLMARVSRPFSTVILNEKVKKALIDDVTDYLNPATRRWYANRGIPYRRGYLLYGAPGTGKSSLSLALAGHFKMRIYIVSLSSGVANEETLSSLFAELPKRCVVLLEDIDTAGLTHTREETVVPAAEPGNEMVPGQITQGNGAGTGGRLSLSGLLNILDGVASQEGRVLIMTTNHLEKLDKALIRPGRVDMVVKFELADEDVTRAIFRAIFVKAVEDEDPTEDTQALAGKDLCDPEKLKALTEDAAKKKAEDDARVDKLAREFAAKVPAHEFSPAEIQGFLLKNKRNPEDAVANAEQFVVDTRKEKKEREIKEAEEKRKAECKKKEEEEKKKKEEEDKKKDEDETKKKEEDEKKKKEEDEKKEERRRRKKKLRKERKKEKGSSCSDTSDTDSDAEKAEKRESKSKPTDTVIVKPDVDKEKGGVLADDKGKNGRDSGYGTP